MTRRYVLAWAIAGVVISLIALGAATPAADSIAAQMSAAGYPPGRVAAIGDRARANQGPLLVGSLRSLAFLALTLGMVWMARTMRLAPKQVAWGFAFLVVVDLWSVERQYWNFSRPARESFATDPAIEAIKAAPEAGRVITIALADGAVSRDPVLFGSALMVHHVRSVTGYHGNELGRYQKVLAQGSLLRETGLTDGLRPEYWRHANVHWLYTTASDTVMAAIAPQLGLEGQFTKVLGPVQNASGSTIYLYRVPGENPAAVVANAVVKGTDEQALATVLDSRFDARRAAIVDTAATIQTSQIAGVPEPSTVQAKTTRYDSGAIDVELSAPVPNTGSMLIVSENFYPGWRASVGGQGVDVIRANYNLIGVPLPAGARQVELRFRDPSYGTGKVVTLLALLISVVLVGTGVAIERRRSAAAAV